METKGLDFAAIPQTAVRVITQPAAFFREMPKTGGFVEPLVFMVVLVLSADSSQAVLSMLHLSVAGGAMTGIAAIVIMPIAIAIFGFVGAGIAFVVWKLMGSQENYETAYRCCAYTSAISPITTVIGIIPYLGSVIGILIGTYYIVMASVEVHGIPAKKAWTVFGIIAVVLSLMSLSGQYAARKFANEAARFQQEMEQTSKEIPEEHRRVEKSCRREGKGCTKTVRGNAKTDARADRGDEKGHRRDAKTDRGDAETETVGSCCIQISRSALR